MRLLVLDACANVNELEWAVQKAVSETRTYTSTYIKYLNSRLVTALYFLLSYPATIPAHNSQQ
jgi:hypothetical protein